MKSFILVSIIVGILFTGHGVQSRYANHNRANDNGIREYAQVQDSQHPFANPEQILLEGPFDLAQYLLSTCPARNPIDYEAVRNTGSCIERVMDNPKLSQLLLLIATNQFQDFGAKACKVWPELRGCFDYVIDYFEQCHDNSQIGKIAETILKFGCSTTREGMERTNMLGDFLTHGGLSCFNLGKFARCMKYALDKTAANNPCSVLEKIRSCEIGFEDCVSPKPWEILSRGLDNLEVELKCDSYITEETS